jgi:hypothetical protein
MSPCTCKDKETYGRVPWHGQETVPQRCEVRKDNDLNVLVEREDFQALMLSLQPK